MVQRINDMDDEQLTKTAEIHAMRFMGDSLSRMAHNMDSMVSKMAQMSTDVALMEQRTRDHDLLWAKLNALEMRAAQQDGAFTLAKAAKDFGPWLVAIAAAIWAYVSGK